MKFDSSKVSGNYYWRDAVDLFLYWLLEFKLLNDLQDIFNVPRETIRMILRWVLWKVINNVKKQQSQNDSKSMHN